MQHWFITYVWRHPGGDWNYGNLILVDELPHAWLLRMIEKYPNEAHWLISSWQIEIDDAAKELQGRL